MIRLQLLLALLALFAAPAHAEQALDAEAINAEGKRRPATNARQAEEELAYRFCANCRERRCTRKIPRLG